MRAPSSTIAPDVFRLLPSLAPRERHHRPPRPEPRRLRRRRQPADDAAAEQRGRGGAKIFADASLSASGQQSCQSCHDFANGLAAPNALAVQHGGVNMQLSGVRNSPSITYMRSEFAFRIDPTDGPFGRLLLGRPREHPRRPGQRALHQPARDGHGRPRQRRRQAARGRATPTSSRPSTGQMRPTTSRPPTPHMTEAVAAFETEDRRFRPSPASSTRCSAARPRTRRGSARLRAVPGRQQGQLLGGHPSDVGAVGALPIFTDRTYDNLGVPRNTEIPANATRPTTTWACATTRPSRPATPRSAARSRCPRCATWRCATASSTTAASTRSRTR